MRKWSKELDDPNMGGTNFKTNSPKQIILITKSEEGLQSILESQAEGLDRDHQEDRTQHHH